MKRAKKPVPREAGESAPAAPPGPGKAPPEQGANNPFKELGGSASPAFNGVMLRQVLPTVWSPKSEHDGDAQRIPAVARALAAFKPEDEIEGMLAAQAVAMHFGAMECFRRAMIPEQTAEVASKLRRDGANLARGMTDMLAALDRKRGKSPRQVVRVENVVIQEGAQAIVGNVQAGATVAPAPASAPPPVLAHEPPGPVLDLPAGAGGRATASVPGRGEA